MKFFDAGDYLCNATNKFGWESKSGSLIVKEHTRFVVITVVGTICLIILSVAVL